MKNFVLTAMVLIATIFAFSPVAVAQEHGDHGTAAWNYMQPGPPFADYWRCYMDGYTNDFWYASYQTPIVRLHQKVIATGIETYRTLDEGDDFDSTHNTDGWVVDVWGTPTSTEFVEYWIEIDFLWNLVISPYTYEWQTTASPLL